VTRSVALVAFLATACAVQRPPAQQDPRSVAPAAIVTATALPSPSPTPDATAMAGGSTLASGLAVAPAAIVGLLVLVSLTTAAYSGWWWRW
jgi:hypothetical protein